MNITERAKLADANRVAAAALVTALGYSPDDVVDRGDGRLDWDAIGRVVLHIAERDADGNVRFDRDLVVAHAKHVRVSRHLKRTYDGRVGA